MEYKIYRFIQSIHHYQDLGGLNNTNIPNQLQNTGEQILQYLDSCQPTEKHPIVKNNLQKATSEYLKCITKISKEMWYSQAQQLATELQASFNEQAVPLEDLDCVLHIVKPKLKWKLGNKIDTAIKMADKILPQLIEQPHSSLHQLLLRDQSKTQTEQGQIHQNQPATYADKAKTIPINTAKNPNPEKNTEKQDPITPQNRLFDSNRAPLNAQGAHDPLSNFYSHKIIYKEKDFRSTEHAYQYEKAMFIRENGIARAILATKSTRKVKMLGNELNKKMPVQTKNRWDKIKLDIMEELLEIKMKVCHTFKQKLINSWPRPITHNAPDKFWGTIYYAKGEKKQGQNKFANCLLNMRYKLKHPEQPRKPKFQNHRREEEKEIQQADIQVNTQHNTNPTQLDDQSFHSIRNTQPEENSNAELNSSTQIPDNQEAVQIYSTAPTDNRNTTHPLNSQHSDVSMEIPNQGGNIPTDRAAINDSDELLLRAVDSPDSSGDITESQLDRITSTPRPNQNMAKSTSPNISQIKPAQIPISGPHSHIHTATDKSNWRLPKFTEKVVVLGDSNIKNITKAPSETKSIETHAFPGAKINHMTEMLKKDRQALKNTKAVILSIGINNKNSTQRINKTQIESLCQAYKAWNPKIQKAIATIQFAEDKLTDKEGSTINKMNHYIQIEAAKQDITVLENIQATEFSVGTDKIHWNNNTGNKLLSAWLNCLNYSVASRDSPPQ